MSSPERNPAGAMLDRVCGRLVADRSVPVLLVIAGGLGFVFAVFLLGWDGIHGTSGYWTTTHNDSLQGIAALRYYADEPWSWPILDVRSYGAPTGTNLILADSIPLLAVPVKALSGVLPDGFHYFGYWLALCFILQAIAIVVLLASLGMRSFLAASAGPVLALLQTALLTRHFHVALMAQFVILGTFIIGVRLMRAGRPIRDLWLLLGLLAAVFFVHLYLYAMVVTVAAGFVLQAGLSRRVGWPMIGGWFGSVAVLTAGLIVTTGIAEAGADGIAGFGYFSSNALSLLVEGVDATGGQYEGAGYLGLGVIVLVGVVLAFGRDLAETALRRYWVPLVVVLLLALFALSTTVWIGTSLRLDLPQVFPVEWLGSRFRSSGRFVWPLVYALVAGALVLVHRRLPMRTGVVLILGVTIIQIVDMAPIVNGLRDTLHDTEGQVLAVELWAGAIERHELVSMVAHQCVVGSGDPSLASREIQRVGAITGVPVTAAAVARRSADCDDPPSSEPLQPGELRVVWDLVDPNYDLAGAHCVRFGLGTACTLPGSHTSVVDSLAGYP